MRPAIQRLVALGPLPSEAAASVEHLQRVEIELASITPPVSDAEARALVALFGPDGCFGLAWTLVHLVESAPGWPIADCLRSYNQWIARLRERQKRSGPHRV